MNAVLFFVIIGFVLIVIYWIYRKNFKQLVCPSFCLVDGGVKTGKSALASRLAIKDYRHRHRVWYFMNRILKIKKQEEPMFYTNATISFGNLKKKRRHKLDRCICRITQDLLLRKERFAYGSVIYCDEASLIADNMDFGDKERNVLISLFCKLIGHETRGGALYYDTQSVLDVHYAFKRCSSTYFFIHKKLNLRLFLVLYVREMVNTENGVNNFTDDVETTTRKVIIPFWHFKKYDCYEFSYLTDTLPVSTDKEFKKGLISFNPLYSKLADRRGYDKKKEKKEGKKA